MNRALTIVSAFLLSLVSTELYARELPQGLDVLGGARSTSKKHDIKEITRWKGLPGWATAVAFSADDQTLAIGLKDRVQLVDVATKAIIRTIELKSGQVRCLAFSSDGQRLAAGSYQGLASLGDRLYVMVRNYNNTTTILNVLP